MAQSPLAAEHMESLQTPAPRNSLALLAPSMTRHVERWLLAGRMLRRMGQMAGPLATGSALSWKEMR